MVAGRIFQGEGGDASHPTIALHFMPPKVKEIIAAVSGMLLLPSPEKS